MGITLADRPKIDKIDIVILKALLNDARAPYVNIAKECGISSNSVKFRVDRLKEEGVITGEITQINPKYLGYNYIAFIPIQACANKIQSVFDYVHRDFCGDFHVLVDVGRSVRIPVENPPVNSKSGAPPRGRFQKSCCAAMGSATQRCPT